MVRMIAQGNGGWAWHDSFAGVIQIKFDRIISDQGR